MRIDPITGEIISDEQESEKQVQEVNNSENVSQDNVEVNPVVREIVEPEVQTQPSQPTGGFDPMTGMRVGADTQQSQATGGFDPMTGKPIGAEIQSSGGFDPMTGMRIGADAQQSQTTGGFDPMTGKPIGAETQPSGGFDPMTGKPLEAAKPVNKKKILVPVIVGAAVLAIAAIVVFIINSGLFLGPAGKIQKAMANTLKEKPHFIEDLQGLEMLTKDEFMLTAKATMGDESVEAEFRSKAGEKQIYGKIDVEDMDVSILAGIDKSKVKVQIPEVDKRVFVYDFKGKNKGYLMEEVDEEELEMVNSLFESVNSKDYDVDKFYKGLTDVTVKEFESLKFEKVEKEKYRVNGDKRSCTGYKTEITEDNMVNIIDGFEEVFTKQCSKEMLEMLEEQGESIDEVFEELREDVEDMDDIELSFYIYKNKLACIKMENTETDQVIEIAFQGGDYRLQNIKITKEYERSEYTYEMKGSVSGTKEKLKFIENGNKDNALEIEYDYKNGDFSIQKEGYGNIDIEGNLKASKSELAITLDQFYYNGTSLGGAKLELTLSKKAKMGKYSGKEFNLGNASEDDWEDLADDIEDAVYDNDLDELLRYF